MSGHPEQEYFTDGITEDVITELARFRSLFVIARNSSLTYKGKAMDVRTVGREMGVRYVLEGSCRKAAARVRVPESSARSLCNRLHKFSDPALRRGEALSLRLTREGRRSDFKITLTPLHIHLPSRWSKSL
jgi:hypothetical protein